MTLNLDVWTGEWNSLIEAVHLAWQEEIKFGAPQSRNPICISQSGLTVRDIALRASMRGYIREFTDGGTEVSSTMGLCVAQVPTRMLSISFESALYWGHSEPQPWFMELNQL